MDLSKVLIKPKVIITVGTIRSDVIHIQLVFCECHEAVYAIISQVALLGNVSHYIAADRRPLPLGTKAGLFRNTLSA